MPAYAAFKPSDLPAPQQFVFPDHNSLYTVLSAAGGAPASTMRACPPSFWPDPVTFSTENYVLNVPSLLQSLTPSTASQWELSSSSSYNTAYDVKRDFHTYDMSSAHEESPVYETPLLKAGTQRNRRKATTGRRSSDKPYDGSGRKAKKGQAQEEPKQRKPPNCYMKFLAGIRPALSCPFTYGLSEDAPAIVGRLWRLVPKKDQEWWIEMGELNLQNSAENPKPKKRGKQEIQPLPGGLTGFHLVEAPIVVEALRIMVRCAVDRVFDQHIDATRFKRSRYAKEDLEVAYKFIDHRERIWKRWQKWQGTDEELPPLFDEGDQCLTPHDLSLFLQRPKRHLADEDEERGGEDYCENEDCEDEAFEDESYDSVSEFSASASRLSACGPSL